MKSRDIVAVLGVAAATMAFALVLMGPARVGAVDAPEGIKPQIAQPKLEVDGCQFTVATDKPAYQPGETVMLQLTGTNPTDEPVETTVWVNVSSVSPRLMVSRVAPPTTMLPWVHQCVMSLEPGQTKTVDVSTEKKLEASQIVSIALSNKDTMAMLRQLTVRPNNTQQQAVIQGGAANQLLFQQ